MSFFDIKPGARAHFQVIPKRHIESIDFLKKEDIPLVEYMHKIGIKICNEKFPLNSYR